MSSVGKIEFAGLLGGVGELPEAFPEKRVHESVAGKKPLRPPPKQPRRGNGTAGEARKTKELRAVECIRMLCADPH